MTSYTVESGDLKETIVAPNPKQAAADFMLLVTCGDYVPGMLIEVTGPDNDPIYFTSENVRKEAFRAILN